ncbi:neurogenic locus notch homolog protein 1-like [Bolinopsis microptera]|uniref:neurogenic locus notch homolog protein 1-like n=1 Tax=Bolinopsis microptera TaxID=2820187 RepID=UPI00307B0DC1
MKTDLAIGSGKDLRINYNENNADFENMGSFVLKFSDPPKYGFLLCTDFMKPSQDLPVDLPAKDDDGFRIFKVEMHGTNGLKISCNDELLITFEPSDAVCTGWSSFWRDTWEKNKEVISFSFDEGVRKYKISSSESADNPECDGFDIERINVRSISPYAFSYTDGDKARIYCNMNYFISWGTSINDVEGNIECDAGNFVPDPAVGGIGTASCVACADNVADCVGGTCTEYGECLCNDGYEKSYDDPRLCTIIQCDAFVLSNQEASADGPYNVDDVVTVTCTAGYHVPGGPYDVNVQTLICGSTGYFDPLLEPCVVCADDNDCTDGTCNSYNICECDASAGYKLREDDLNVCEEVTCPEKYCSYGGECSVRDIELVCDCPQGTEGDTCEQFTSTPCDPDPCEKGETCSRVMTDPADYTKHECTTAACEGTFNGDCCQVVIQFHDGAICMF